MKTNLLYCFITSLFLFLLVTGFSDKENQVNTNLNFNNDIQITKNLAGTSDTITPANFPYPVVWNWYYRDIPGPNFETVGATYFQGKYILNRWDASTMYRFNPDGPGGGPGTISDSNNSYAGQIRDMTVAPDGSGQSFLWGGRASTVLYKMNANGTTVSQYTHAGASYRAIAWDPNRKGFWSCNFSDNIVCRDTNGVVIRTLTNTLTGKYGMAFDSTTSADSAFLWVWSQGGTGLPNQLQKIHIQSNTVASSYTFQLVNGTDGIAGGAEIFVKDNQLILALNFQEYAVVAYKLKDLNPPPPICNYQWSQQTSGTTSVLYSVSAVSDQICWAAGVGATVRVTTNGGSTWGNGNAAPGVITGDIYNIFAWSANDALCTTSPSATNIYKTSNGGATWTQVFTLAGGFINAIQMISPTEGYAQGDPVGGVWSFLRTTNGGTNWTQMATAPAQVGGEAGWNNSMLIIGNNVWWGTNQTRAYRSTDLGLTWSSGATTGSVNSYAIHYNSPTTGLAGGNAMTLSTNGGANYTTVTSPGTAGNINSLEGNGTDWWATRTGNTVFRSTDGAATWSTAYTLTGAAFNDMDFAVVGGCPVGWAVSSAGLIAKMSNLVNVIGTSSEIPSSFSLMQNYPNPFNPETNINFSIPKSGLVTLKIYDISGKEVATLVNELKNAGSYVVGFNAANLPSGAYFYRMQTEGFAETKKMMLIK
ncbi:MAG TPA: T9SS type A sorting domain-containing protein [Ignavibacteria bacterium]|nr:T9SS type A sorting domain-containing protein [Ignavibacteria bacterium]HRJ98340.1 T9SS type A sorting domain-containing protein [Ignavibacteria bacterium]